MFTPDRLFRLLLSLPAFIAAFTLHEFAHAWMADRLGDSTPRRLGRLTLDPLAHLDPMGSMMFVLTQLAGYGLGWAKPVPFNPSNFDRPRRDIMLVAVAGPVSNLLQMPLWLLALWATRVIAAHNGVVPWEMLFGNDFSPMAIAVDILSTGVIVNILLAAFNMIPIPPLDGHYILEGLGPPFIGEMFAKMRPYCFMLLLMISYTGVLRHIIGPAMGVAYHLVFLAMGAPL